MGTNFGSLVLYGLYNTLTMPRKYKCRKCGIHHDPPTGKHCRMRFEEPEDDIEHEPQDIAADETESVTPEQEAPDILPLLLEIKRRVDDIDSRVGKNSDAEATTAHIEPFSPPSIQLQSPPRIVRTPERAIERYVTDITPTSLRHESDVMARAANRLARIKAIDDDEQTALEDRRTRTGGKKSGCKLVAGESVLERIDWPHMYVTRMAGGKRTGVPFAELRLEEFVFGFISMLESPFCRWDYRTMTRLLRMMMQDVMDFSWPNARALYQMIGVEVEQGTMEWTDTDAIREMRFTHSRVGCPEKEREKKETQTQKPAPKQAPPGTRACVAYQTRSCEQANDHSPFVHACSYCLKACNLLFRHAENDCIRRVTDAAKNGKKREL